MQKKSAIFTILTLLVTTLFYTSSVFAGDIEWSGLYRIEGYSINNSELRDNNKKRLDYGLSHLVLRPKITAGDGLTIYGQFDVFNSSKYPNSQMGQIWGDGVGGSGTDPHSASNSTSNVMANETIAVTQLYLTYTHEFGQLVVGRVPLQFGLGMTYSAGRGLFDHFFDTRDLVGYKVILGNFWFLPMIGKPTGGDINHSNDIDDYMIQAEYENPETDLQMGIFFRWRKGGDQAADGPVGVDQSVSSSGQVLGGAGGTNAQSCVGSTCTSAIDTKEVNVYVLKDSPTLRLGLEASFMSGDSGVHTAADQTVSFGGFGIAGEIEYRPQASRWKWGLKAGFASGDDPTTDNKFEGYQFNRNYDVAMLLFNHPLGQRDMLRSGLVTGSVRDQGGSATTTTGNINQADVEAISNAIYLAPRATYQLTEHWSMDHALITGWLDTQAVDKQVGTSLGMEYDFSLSFTPRKGVQWINQFGVLFPGQAWKGDGSLTSSTAFGFGTKAAISF